MRAQPVTDLAPYVPAETGMLDPLKQVRNPVFSTVSALSVVSAGGAPTRRLCSKEGRTIMPEQQVIVIGGVDTHRDDHVAATVDSTGRLLGVARQGNPPRPL